VTRFGALVGIFLRDLSRRKMVWLLLVVTLAIVAIYYGTQRAVEESIGGGDTWEVATRRAASRLDQLAATLRGWLGIVTILLAAQVAPESRRNGTTQFVLSLGVGRGTLAAAQLTALSILLTALCLILHAGFAVAGLRTNAVTTYEVAVAWLWLLVPLLALGAAVFAISLTASPLETCLLFIGVPLLARTIPGWAHGFPKGAPHAIVRAVENLGLFFPELDEIIAWPHTTYGSANGAPYADWHAPAAHLAAAIAFWIVVGLALHRHHDFGSRTAVK
jgi:hypothetical protein